MVGVNGTVDSGRTGSSAVVGTRGAIGALSTVLGGIWSEFGFGGSAIPVRLYVKYERYGRAADGPLECATTPFVPSTDSGESFGNVRSVDVPEQTSTSSWVVSWGSLDNMIRPYFTRFVAACFNNELRRVK